MSKLASSRTGPRNDGTTAALEAPCNCGARKTLQCNRQRRDMCELQPHANTHTVVLMVVVARRSKGSESPVNVSSFDHFLARIALIVAVSDTQQL